MENFDELNLICDQNYKTPQEIEWKVEEIRLYTSFGILAGKYWGKKDVQPILVLHGWLDNAGSFDRLIPLLPKHLSFLVIDLPGHGLSSRLQDGWAYHLVNYIHIVDFVVRTYKWEKVSILGHSLGSVLGYFYASMFPDKVKCVIGIDALKPGVVNEENEADMLINKLKESLKADTLNQSKSEPPSHTIDELLERIHVGTYGAVPKKIAPYLLRRNIKKSVKNPGKYYFSSDARIKSGHKIEYGHHVSMQLAKTINMPYLFIKASDHTYFGTKEQHQEVVNVLSENRDFYNFFVEGTHYVHFTHPELIAPAINEFLNRYCSKVK